MTKPDDQNPDNDREDSPDELLGDLESIKQLLDEEEQAAAQAAEVPLLDDMVSGAYTLDESASLLSATPALGGGKRTEGSHSPAGEEKEGKYLSEDLFEALLGDRWRSSASDILTEARGAIEAHRNEWTPEDTDELNQALRVRIDETLTEWLKETVRERMNELHAALLQTAEATIDEKIRRLIDSRRTAYDEDGCPDYAPDKSADNSPDA